MKISIKRTTTNQSVRRSFYYIQKKDFIEKMKISLIDIIEEDKKEAFCWKVLKDLPLWFGLAESNEEYAKKVRSYRFIEIIYEKKEIGFISIKRNNEFVAEIYVMGILSQYHRQGIGSIVIDRICRDSKGEGYRYLEVKTLDETRESEEYRRTRLFYRKVGFIPLDVLTNEWGIQNPCLIMIKKL
jgi:ribosomal protein S18 acetylase RimI-like enzyme